MSECAIHEVRWKFADGEPDQTVKVVLYADHAAALAEREEQVKRLDEAHRYELGANNALRSEVERLKDDQSDWRKGVDLIRSSLACKFKELSCVDISHVALELRADNEALRARLAKLEEAARLVTEWDHRKLLISHPDSTMLAERLDELCAALEVKP